MRAQGKGPEKKRGINGTTEKTPSIIGDNLNINLNPFDDEILGNKKGKELTSTQILAMQRKLIKEPGKHKDTDVAAAIDSLA